MRTKIIHIFLFFFISYSFSEEFHNYYHHTPTVQFDVPLSHHNTKPDSHIRSPQRDSIPHNSRDRYHFIYFSVTDFQRSFSHIPEKEILERYELFSLPNFRAYARTLSGYNQFIVALDTKIKQDKHFKKQTAFVPGFDYTFGLWSEKSGFHDFIAAQASEIRKKQSEKKPLSQKGTLCVTDRVAHQLTQEWSARKKYAYDTTRLDQRLDALSKAKATQGTHLDDQLNKELSESRHAMHSLERTFSHDNHVQALSPVVHSCAQQVAKESDAIVAFGLSDFCFIVTDVLQHGMNVLYDASYAVTKGACKGISTFACIEHWKDMATGALHMSLLCADAMVIQDVQLYYAALSDLIVPESQAMTHLKKSQHLHTHEQIKKALEAVCTTRETLEAMSWQECIENSSKIATTMILDALVFHAMGQCTQTASNAFMRELAKVTESGQLFSKEYAVEIAGFGKLIVEDGPQVATQSAGLIKKDLVHFADSQSVIPQIRQQVCPTKWTEEIAHKIRNIGDDILDVMEKAGGHTMELHVGKTHSELLARARNTDLAMISTFDNKSLAIKSVKENLKKNCDEILLWLQDNPPLNKPKTFDCFHSYEVGKGLVKGKKNGLIALNKSRIVLLPNFSNEFGFEIKTSFPIS